ncbi:MAG: hypothetical protein E7317_06180, partial [Clostridiales bacterium]|nr:hypothetical protein [Clostridiales bacterium]
SAVHCTDLGIDMTTLGPRRLAWVLSGTHVGFDRLPVIGDTVSLETYPMPVRHFFFPRMYIFRDAAGARLGAAYSLWMTMDMQARKAVRDAFVESRVPDNSGRAVPIAMPRPVKPLEAETRTSRYAPRFTDFDINGHVNNTRYMDMCVNELGFDTMREYGIVDFTVQFESEIRPGVELSLTLAREQSAFTFQGHADGKRMFSVGGTLRRREA